MSPASDDDKSAPTEDEAAKIAADVYIFGYPLVLMDVTSRRVDPVELRENGAG